jgi:hypothetical protein
MKVFNGVLLIIAAVAIIYAGWVCQSMNERLDEQIMLREEMITDCDYLTKLNTSLQKQVELLEEKARDQEQTIDRLMKLEAKTEIEAVGMTEARGEPLLSQVATLQTMLDRANEYGISVKSVVEAPGQYAPAYPGPISDSMDTAFDLVYLDGYRAFQEPTTHFATYPAWSRGKVFRGRIGTHYYYGGIKNGYR